jgi:hypothetical protein
MAGNNFQAALYVAVLVGYYEEYFIKDSPFNDLIHSLKFGLNVKCLVMLLPLMDRTLKCLTKERMKRQKLRNKRQWILDTTNENY